MNHEEEVNERGGRQSNIGRRFDLVDPQSIMRLAETLHHGAQKYGDFNWLNLTSESCLSHAENHIAEHKLGMDLGEDHLAHAFCRIMMAMVLEKIEQNKPVAKVYLQALQRMAKHEE